MKIVKPFAQIQQTDAETIMLNIEKAARLCYKSEGKMSDTYNSKFITSKIKAGHLSVIEHSIISVLFVVDRGISHEIVRHRLASFSQESTRYCNYAGDGITVIEPCFYEPTSEEYNLWKKSCENSERDYLKLISNGSTPEKARAVLPHSLKTELLVSMNLRQWRHFLELRALNSTGKAHPQMLEVAIPLLHEFKALFPPVFEDLML